MSERRPSFTSIRRRQEAHTSSDVSNTKSEAPSVRKLRLVWTYTKRFCSSRTIFSTHDAGMLITFVS